MHSWELTDSSVCPETATDYQGFTSEALMDALLPCGIMDHTSIFYVPFQVVYSSRGLILLTFVTISVGNDHFNIQLTVENQAVTSSLTCIALNKV